jgi:hypothetical protein
VTRDERSESLAPALTTESLASALTTPAQLFSLTVFPHLLAPSFPSPLAPTFAASHCFFPSLPLTLTLPHALSPFSHSLVFPYSRSSFPVTLPLQERPLLMPTSPAPAAGPASVPPIASPPANSSGSGWPSCSGSSSGGVGDCSSPCSVASWGGGNGGACGWTAAADAGQRRVTGLEALRAVLSALGLAEVLWGEGCE